MKKLLAIKTQKQIQKMNLIFTFPVQEVFPYRNSFSLDHWKTSYARNTVLLYDYKDNFLSCTISALLLHSD